MKAAVRAAPSIDENVRRRMETAEAQIDGHRRDMRWTRNTCLITGAITIVTPFLPLPETGLVLLGMVAVSSFVMCIIHGVSNAWNHDTVARLRSEAGDRAVPAHWSRGGLSGILDFMHELEAVAEKGLEEYDRPRVQHLADAYCIDVMTVLPQGPWKNVENDARIAAFNKTFDPRRRLLLYVEATADLQKHLQGYLGPDADLLDLREAVNHAHVFVVRMAKRFGLDMGAIEQTKEALLPGEEGNRPAAAPIPDELLSLIAMYRVAERGDISDEDRIAGDALVGRDVPMMAEAWRRAIAITPPSAHAAIDERYHESAALLAGALSRILDSVAADTVQRLDAAKRYIMKKHDAADPFEPENAS